MKEVEICDGCGKAFDGDQVRYVLRIEVYAEAKDLEITEDKLLEDQQSRIEACLRQLSERDPESLQDEVYRSFEFLLCLPCQKRYITNPLQPLCSGHGDTLGDSS